MLLCYFGVTQIMKTLNLFHAIVLCLKTDRFFLDICLNKPFFFILIKFDLDLTKTLDIAFLKKFNDFFALNSRVTWGKCGRGV